MERPSVLEDADVLVHSSTREDPENELTINARDPALGVYWPRLDDVREAITSDEDGAAPPLLQAHDRFVDTVPGVPRPLGRALVVGASGNVGGAIEEKYGAANVIGTYKNEARTEDGYVYLDIEAVAEDETLAEEIMTSVPPRGGFYMRRLQLGRRMRERGGGSAAAEHERGGPAEPRGRREEGWRESRVLLHGRGLHR